MTLVVSPPHASERSADARLLTDFTPDSASLGWYVVNDSVMGGRSEGAFELDRGVLRFAGETNTDGGGFSSIRTESLQLDLSNHAGIRVRARGDGRRYTWRLTTTARWRGRPVSYWAEFPTQDGAWTEIDIPFASFVPRFRGNQLDGPELDPAAITGMGLMIYDKRDGPFEIHLAAVYAFVEEVSFTLSRYRWKNRVLAVSAAGEDDENLAQLRDGVAATLDKFADRDMVLVTLLDDAVSTADKRVLTNAEVVAIRSSLGMGTDTFALRLIGKDGSVKLSSDRATPMTDIYALIDSMPMRQREQSRP